MSADLALMITNILKLVLIGLFIRAGFVSGWTKTAGAFVTTILLCAFLMSLHASRFVFLALCLPVLFGPVVFVLVKYKKPDVIKTVKQGEQI
jgi:hypothetical protein